MPNYAFNKIRVAGSPDTLARLKEQVKQPYQDPVFKEERQGDFLMWNIVKPDNLALYVGDKNSDDAKFNEIIEQNPDLSTPSSEEDEIAQIEMLGDVTDLVAEIQHKIATGMGWYEWNIRNWGTKWETDGDKSHLVEESAEPDLIGDYSLVYRTMSAWSPPAEALDKLAEQYPDVTIYLDSIDDNDCWAMTGLWRNGERQLAEDVRITHENHIVLTGYCWSCDKDDPDYAENAEWRKEFGCPDA